MIVIDIQLHGRERLPCGFIHIYQSWVKALKFFRLFVIAQARTGRGGCGGRVAEGDEAARLFGITCGP